MRTLILGVGNILMGDEGFGQYIIEELSKEKLPEGVDLLDAGTATLDIADLVIDYQRLIILDTVKTGDKPGSIYKFRPEDIRQRKQEELSLHQCSLLDAINMLKITQDVPSDIMIIAIEPEDVSMRIGISNTLRNKTSKIKQLIQEELKNDCHRIKAN